MARMILKERQFEPTGINLGDFESKDLETFDIQFKDSDMEEQSGAQGGGGPQSHVPNPVDPDPLKKDNKSKGSSGSSGQSSSNNNNQNQEPEGDQGLPDIPDKWDPYGNDLDSSDPDTPDPIDMSNSDDSFGGGGSGEEEESEVSQPVTGGNNDSGENDGEESQNSNNSTQSGEQGQNGQSGESGDNSGEEDNGQQGNMTGSSGDSQSNQDNNGDSSQSGDDSGSQSSGQQSDDGEGSGEDSNSQSNNTQGGADRDNNQKGGSNQHGTSEDARDDTNRGMEYDPNHQEIPDDDDDFDPAGDIKSYSDLEKALDKLSKSETESSKQKRESEEENQKKDEDNPYNNSNKGRQQQRDREEEAAAAKEILSKAIQDKKERDRLRETEESDDYTSSSVSESEDDILAELGAGNLTTLFNPNTARDWRVQLDRLFDKALGFDIVTNPNLVNKKIEDAPPGREDFDPVIKNIVILLDYSGSMGAIKFKEVISHIDTMLRARKLTKTTFHIFPWGSRDVGVLLDMYTKCKGMMFKKTINSKFKEGHWGTYLTPVIPVVMKKVHKPDAVIIMTDAEIFDDREFNDNSICTSFIRKYKNRIIWALTSDGKPQNAAKFDPTVVSKKRYIKFKKGGSK